MCVCVCVCVPTLLLLLYFQLKVDESATGLQQQFFVCCGNGILPSGLQMLATLREDPVSGWHTAHHYDCVHIRKCFHACASVSPSHASFPTTNIFHVTSNSCARMYSCIHAEGMCLSL